MKMLNLKLILVLMMTVTFQLFAANVAHASALKSPFKDTLFLDLPKIININGNNNSRIASNSSKLISSANLSKNDSLTDNNNYYYTAENNELYRIKRYGNYGTTHSYHDNSFAINDYKKFLREESADKFQQEEILEFYNLLGEHPKVQTHVSAVSLVKEFKSLEKQNFIMKTKLNFRPFYESLLNQISVYAKQPKTNEKHLEYRKLYIYLYTATLSKMHALGQNSEPNLIVDTAKYMKFVREKFEDISQLQTQFKKVETLNKHNEQFKARFQSKLQEAVGFIEQEITPEIGNINKLLDYQIDQIMNENEGNINQSLSEVERAKERKKKMEKNMVLGKIFGLLKVCTQVVSFIGPVGSAIGTVVGAGTSVAESLLISKDVGGKPSDVQLPAGVMAKLDKFNANMKFEKDQKLEGLNRKLDTITTELDSIGKKEFIGPRNEIGRIRTAIEELKSKDDYDPKQMKALNKELSLSLKAEVTDLKKQSKNTEDEFAKKAARMVKVAKLATAASTTLDAYNTFKRNKRNVAAADEALEAAENKVRQLQEYEDRIYDMLIPMKRQMLGDLYKVADELKGKSLVALDVKKWQVQKNLKDIKLYMRKFIEGFAVQDNFTRSIEKLEEVMTTLINIYDRMENYEEQKHLADYLRDINSDASTNIRFSNSFLSSQVAELEIIIKSNVVIGQYDLTINALKQWLFPFSDYYLGDFQLPAHLYDSGSDQLEQVIFQARNKIQELDDKIQTYKAVIHGQDEYIFSGKFDSKYASSNAFFTWSNEKYGQEIGALLRGEEVWLLADVEQSDRGKDAIKFNSVEFQLNVQEVSKRSAWRSKLKGFYINAVHTGNSYYRFKGERYVFNSRNQSIVYSFEKRESNGEPVFQNEVSRKISEGDITLSPYTMWRLKLVPALEKYKFDLLEDFKDDVYIELVGTGSFVRNYVRGTDDKGWKQYIY